MMSEEIVKIIIEVHRNISVANIYINLGYVFEGVDIRIRDNEIAIRIAHVLRPLHHLKLSISKQFFIPASFHSQRGTLSKFLKTDQEVEAEYLLLNACKYILPVVRLQVRPSELFLTQDLENLNVNSSTNDELRTDVPYYIFCSACCHKLAESAVSFKKISNLPFDFTELYENLFCHKESPERKLDIVSQPSNELLVTATCYVLSCLNESLISEDFEMDVIRCQKCLSVLCCTKRKNLKRFKDSVFCFKDKITFETVPELVLSIDSSIVNAALNSLLSIIRDTFESSMMCKLYLEAKVPVLEDDCLLIWVVDQNMKRFVSTQEIFRESRPCVEETIEFKSVMKVLYHVTSSASEFARAWVHDFSVDFHHISDTMLTNVAHYLKESSCNMPHIAGYPMSFSVGYIPLKL